MNLIQEVTTVMLETSDNSISIKLNLDNIVEFEELSERLKLQINAYQEILSELEQIQSDIQDTLYDLDDFEFEFSTTEQHSGGGDG